MAVTTNGLGIFRNPDPLDMKAAPGTTFPLSVVGATLPGTRFLPQAAYIFLRSMSGGALTTSPGIRLGTNGAHNNLCPIFIPPTNLVINQIGTMPFATPLIAPLIDTVDLFGELTQAAVGPTIMLADIVIAGLLIG